MADRTSDPVRYWDGIAELDDTLPPAWRRQARVEHLELLDRWVGRLHGRWLKTDLYEERTADRAMLPYLGEATWVGMDLAPEVLHRAGAATRVAAGGLVATDVCALAFAEASFDGVLSTSTLDHFDDRSRIRAALAELHRVLRPGGHLVVTLDNPQNPLIRLRNALPHGVARRTGLSPFEVGATLDRRALIAELDGLGFDVRAAVHLLHVPHIVGTRLAGWPWYARRVLPRWQRLATTPLAPWSGHYVAAHAVRR